MGATADSVIGAASGLAFAGNGTPNEMALLLAVLLTRLPPKPTGSLPGQT